MGRKSLVEKIEELKAELEELELKAANSSSSKDRPFEVGEKYFIRTVTYHLTGQIKAIRGNFLVLKDAAWIADSGRFMQAINDGVLNEVEPVNGEVLVNIQSITDAFEWTHKLPREQK